MKWRKICWSVVLGILAVSGVRAENEVVDVANYTVVKVSSQTVSDMVQKAFDGDSATWWALNTSVYGGPLPAQLVLDLGSETHVSGFYYLPNKDNTSDKLLSYEIYVSNDINAWGDAQAKARIFWNSDTDVSGKDLLIGAVKGRYVKLVYVDNANDWNDAIQTAELRVYADTSVKGFKKNQHLEVASVPSVVSVGDTTLLEAKASSGLDVTFEVVSGPAKVEKKDTVQVLTYTGEEGVVVVKAMQEGDDTWYPVEYLFSWKVENPSMYQVSLFTNLIEDEPIVMPSDTMYYVLQARAEIGSEFNTITDMQVKVDGETLESDFDAERGYIRARFMPGKYGEFDVEFTATASNGTDTTVRRTMTVDSADESRTVRSFDGLIINFPDPGRTNGGVYRFPQHVGSYRSIVAKLDVKCPDIEGGCDDWDRVAWVEIQTPDGQWREIIRYTTAFGVPCDHELDVTDFASLLQGEVPMRMFVDTWGTGGYEVYLDFEFDKGLPQYLYSEVTPLWSGNFPFGDMANLQPLDTLSVSLDEDVVAASLKMVITGHGWGSNNSDNAAEFYPAKNELYVNGTRFDHDLLRVCKPNPDNCTGQRGTWAYDRCGWCPGSIAPGTDFNVTGQLTSKEMKLTYLFDPDYVDYCHSSNPECVSGETCTDCFDTYNPQFYVSSYLITHSNKMYDSLPEVGNEKYQEREELSFNTYPNPASDKVMVQVYGETGYGYVQLIGMNGQIYHQHTFGNASELGALEISVADVPSGVYFIRIQTQYANGIRKVVVR